MKGGGRDPGRRILWYCWQNTATNWSFFTVCANNSACTQKVWGWRNVKYIWGTLIKTWSNRSKSRWRPDHRWGPHHWQHQKLAVQLSNNQNSLGSAGFNVQWQPYLSGRRTSFFPRVSSLRADTSATYLQILHIFLGSRIRDKSRTCHYNRTSWFFFNR